MRILQIHNFYQHSGGEDVAVANEEVLLTRRGHQVWQYSLHNQVIPEMPRFQVALKTLWNETAYRTVRNKIQKLGIELVHAHNTFPLTSPAIYYAAQAEKVPVVQTLHNYRLLCPAATLYRQGRPCEECLGRILPWPAVPHHCYRNSSAASGVTALMLGTHRAASTYLRKVDAYIAPSRFSMEKFIQGGLPRNRIRLKSNFVLDDPGIGSGHGGYALYLGRLVPEKGLETLLRAWAALSIPITLKIAGDGPLRSTVESAAQTIAGVEYLGACPRARVNELLRNAALLVFPSEWYEVSPLSVIEAMACGTPVLASDHGSLSEMIVSGENGFLFPVGDVGALVSAVDAVFITRDCLADLRFSTRQYYESHFAAGPNYQTLLDIYKSVSTQGVH